MSRRKNPGVTPHVTYGQLELRCPANHPLGAILVTLRGALHRLERPLHDKLPAPSHPITPGKTLSFQCAACRTAHQRSLFELTWDRLTELLAEQQADTSADRRVIKIS